MGAANLSESDAAGEVVIGGRRGGRTESLERTFLVAVAAAKDRDGEKVYVVVGPDSSEAFREKVRELCPVVEDASARGVCMILAGTPDEWEPLDAA